MKRITVAVVVAIVFSLQATAAQSAEPEQTAQVGNIPLVGPERELSSRDVAKKQIERLPASMGGRWTQGSFNPGNTWAVKITKQEPNGACAGEFTWWPRSSRDSYKDEPMTCTWDGEKLDIKVSRYPITGSLSRGGKHRLEGSLDVGINQPLTVHLD